MIPRYTRPEMSAIWSDANRFVLWLEIEALALEGMAKVGLIPASAAAAVRSVGSVDPKRVLEIEAEVKHDVIAFLTAVSEKAGIDARFMHRGLTSNDLLDTAFAVQLSRSADLILAGVDKLLATLVPVIEAHRQTLCIGRSHGMHAEPMTFGLKLAGWYAEMCRAKVRLLAASDEIRVGKMSGAVGTYASLSPEVESFVLGKLGLRPEVVATQVVARDRHAAFFGALSLLGSSLDRFCTEIRHLQRSEVAEVQEPFGSGQKGSSAMPHKRNPILCENICGLARLLRSYSNASSESVALWHERDISHSSVERVIAPDACQLADFMLERFSQVVAGMTVDTERMRKNLESGNGVIFSGGLLLALADAGLSREQAYSLVQKHAFAASEGGASLAERVMADEDVLARVPRPKLEVMFDARAHLAQVGFIIDRALAAQGGIDKV